MNSAPGYTFTYSRRAAKHFQTIVLSERGGTIGHILRILDRVGPVIQDDVSRRHIAAAVHHVTVTILTRRRRGPLHKQRPLLAALVIAAGGWGRYTGRRTATVHWWIGAAAAAAALVSPPRMAGSSEQPSRGHDLLFMEDDVALFHRPNNYKDTKCRLYGV